MELRPRIYIPATMAVIAAAAAVGCSSASAGPVSHTMTFIADQKAGGAVGQQDTDLDASGKVVGYDILSFAFDPTTKKTTVDVAVAASGGMLYGTVSATPNATGNVTGGLGSFQGATGTITTKNISNTKTQITITYHT